MHASSFVKQKKVEIKTGGEQFIRVNTKTYLTFKLQQHKTRPEKAHKAPIDKG